MAKLSMLVAAVFGLFSSLMVAYTGDESARTLSKVQPVKFAAMEALYDGKSNAGLVAIGLLKNSDKKIGDKNIKRFIFKIEIPDLLSVLTAGDKDGYVQGINDHINGNESEGVMSMYDKMERGKYARDVLLDYQRNKMLKDDEQLGQIKALFSDPKFYNDYFRYYGYAFIKNPEEIIPNVSIAFYSFHLMVILGFSFILLFVMVLYFLYRGTLTNTRWFLWIALLAIPLPYVASELGWILTEVGRQPWIIQDMMTVSMGVSGISSGSVITTFILFAVLFTVLLISEISIMIKQIKTGPKH